MSVIFDTTVQRRNRDRAARMGGDHDFLHALAANRLEERLSDIKREFATALQISDLCPRILIRGVQHAIIAGHSDGIHIQEDVFPFADCTLDIIINILRLHTINDLPGALIQMRRALRPDGLFIACMLGGETLYELRASMTETELALKGGISPRVHPFADKQQMGALMQRAGFALPVVDSEIITVSYASLRRLMHDLRGMGEGNALLARSKIYPGRYFFDAVETHYRAQFANPDQTLRASFELIFLIGWAPHEDQQKPLRPGTAQTRLADALNTHEEKL